MRTIQHKGFRELIPDAGKVLTQTAAVSPENRIYATAVALGKGARADAWTEVDASAAAPVNVED